MIKIVAIAMILLTVVPVAAQVQIYARDGRYLGNITNNPYDPNSISNPYGQYGSPYSPNSINNQYGVYGSPYSSLSPNNIYYPNDGSGLYTPPFGPND